MSVTAALLLNLQTVHSRHREVSAPPTHITFPRVDVTDSQRIEGFLRGSRQEVEEIVGWVATVVHSRLWADRVCPDDVIADTITKLLEHLSHNGFRVESTLKTHVQRIALYTLIDAIRRERRFVHLDSQADIPDHQTPAILQEREEEAYLIERTIALLPEGCKGLFSMVLDERRSCREIGEHLGISEGAVKTRLSRCREKALSILRSMR